MKNRFVNIALFVGIAFFNLSVLCQGHCAGSGMHKPHGHADLDGATFAVCTGHASNDEEKSSVTGGLYDDRATFMPALSFDTAGVNTDIRLTSLSVEAASQKEAYLTVTPAYAAFIGAVSAPSERPPWPFV